MYGKLTSKTVFSIPVTLTTMYQHSTYKFDSLSYWMNYKFPGKPLSTERLDYQLNKSQTYRKHYSTANGFTFIYWTDAGEMSAMADLLFERGKEKKDSVSLKKALELVQEQRNILRLFKFSPLREKRGVQEADILMELKRKPEAITSLKEIIASEADDDVKQGVKKRLREIEEGKIK